ncbi:CD83 antigen-like [Chelmon rostratus]|uniref:CD83 antigen-like n=1 Tax=Chelmon rostratus TaxID=109905 RepID=UPI001BE938E3|nr:CD83 antigen-like [Chelmon rostratus]
MCAGPLGAALLLTLCVKLAVGTPVTEDVLQFEAVLGADGVLPCTARYEPGVQYRVRWYKVGEPPSPRLSGLLTRDLPNGTTRWYRGVEREVALLGESHSILLPNVTCGDSGVYMCHLAAPVGEQNREGKVLLTLTDCPDSPTEDLMTDSYMVIVAIAVLMFALVIFLICYVSLKNILRERNSKTTIKETFLDAPLKPLGKKDLMLIYTLGPKVSKTPTLKHICV